MRLRKSAHTVYKAQYHIVWITRYRRKILPKWVKGCLKIKLLEIRKYYPEWEYLGIGIDLDHIHLYMLIPLKYAVSKVAETKKSNTSKALKIKFAFLKKVYWDNQGRGYGPKVILSPQLESTRRSSEHTSKYKKRKIQDQHSLSFKRTTPVKAWESR